MVNLDTTRKEIFLDLDKNKMNNQHYNLSAMAVANVLGYWDDEKQQRVFSKSVFRSKLKENLKIGYRKANKILDTFEELGCIYIEDDMCYLNKVSGSSFLKIDLRTMKYCLDNLSDANFKIYCYLFNKYNLHNAYKYEENYFFSKQELLDMLGYTKTGESFKKVTSHLLTLKKLGLINFNGQWVNRGQGRYYELYAVYAQSNVQIEMAQKNSGWNDDTPLYYSENLNKLMSWKDVRELLDACSGEWEGSTAYNCLSGNKFVMDKINDYLNEKIIASF